VGVAEVRVQGGTAGAEVLYSKGGVRYNRDEYDAGCHLWVSERVIAGMGAGKERSGVQGSRARDQNLKGEGMMPAATCGV
jgi:hypothetical protein